MKIAVTISDVGAAVNVGGVVSVETAIIELTEDQIPNILKQYFDNIEKCKQNKFLSNYQNVMFSLFVEE